MKFLCFRFCFAVPLLLAVPSAWPQALSAPSSQQKNDVTSTPAAVAAAPAAAANGAAPGQPTAPKPMTAVSLERLPKPLPPELTQSIDVDTRSAAILSHLNEMIRFYRMTVIPIQKTGEPSDILYAEQAQAAATQAAQLAFQSSRDEAALLARMKPQAGESAPDASPESDMQRMLSAQKQIAARVSTLQAQQQTLQKQMDSARGATREGLQQQLDAVQGQLELSQAALVAMAKVSGISALQSNSGLQGDIDRLQHSVPELVDSKIKPVANSIESLGALRDEGVSSQAVALFQLLGTSQAINERIAETDKLHAQATDLRTPLVNILRATLDAGQKLQSGADSNTKETYGDLVDAFRAISDVSVPISQEMLLLEQARGNLQSWRAAVDGERSTILRSLLLRVLSIAIALGVLFVLSEVWRRATTRYVQDVRRRRQLLLVRRLVIGFLGGMIVIFGFVTQFSSLATFAGFITAGIAVGLQTILLSVAAYFFIIGRYGVRVGDRITVAGVTGDVVEVGLVRFYMMELTGTGTELHPTGRVAVFANSVLFQSGTPLYKQMPGTNYAWHELTLKLKPGSDYHAATEAVKQAVEGVYATYQAQIEQQHAQVELWMDAAVRAPQIECRLQLADGLQYVVLYPVQIDEAAKTDGKVVQSVLSAITKNEAVTQAVDGAPTVKAVIKT